MLRLVPRTPVPPRRYTSHNRSVEGILAWVQQTHTPSEQPQHRPPMDAAGVSDLGKPAAGQQPAARRTAGQRTGQLADPAGRRAEMLDELLGGNTGLGGVVGGMVGGSVPGGATKALGSAAAKAR